MKYNNALLCENVMERVVSYNGEYKVWSWDVMLCGLVHGC